MGSRPRTVPTAAADASAPARNPIPSRTSSKSANPPPGCSNPPTWTPSAWTAWTWVKALYSTGNTMPEPSAYLSATQRSRPETRLGVRWGSLRASLRYSARVPFRARPHASESDTFAGAPTDTEAGCGSRRGALRRSGGAARDVERPACLVSFCLRQPLSWRSSSSSHRSPKSVNVSICAETRLVVTSSDSNKSRRVCGLPGLTPGK